MSAQKLECLGFFVPGFEGEKSHLVGAEAANSKSLIVKRKRKKS